MSSWPKIGQRQDEGESRQKLEGNDNLRTPDHNVDSQNRTLGLSILIQRLTPFR